MASSNTTIPPSWSSETTSTTLRDASFSSYLNSSEESFIKTLVNSTHKLNYQVIPNPIRPERVKDQEIDVFSADKYFNGEVDQQKSNNAHAQNTVISLSKLNLQPRTPSIHSESSWNSQSALLRPVPRNPSKRSNIVKEKKPSFLSSCYCCDKKSVDILDRDDEFTNHGHRSFDNNSSFPRELTARTIKTSFDTAEIAQFNKLRLESHTEPFTFPTTWDAIPKSYEEISTTRPQSGTHDDTESDASSDLFEIECLRQGNGPYGSATPTTGYEPSEASVDWSVVTASAANFYTLSDTEDQKSTKSTLTSVTDGAMGVKSRSTVKRVVAKGGQKPRSLGMLGVCTSQKAVRVSEDAYSNRKTTSECQRMHNTRCSETYSPSNMKSGTESQRMRRLSECYSPVTRFQSVRKLSGLSVRPKDHFWV